MNGQIVEWIGYGASAIILVSLLMSSIIKLRWINLAGSIFFSIYGYLIGSIPVMIMNMGIVAINSYYLSRIYGSKEKFEMLAIDKNSEFYNMFMDYNKNEIQKFFITDEFSLTEDSVGFYILRNLITAGIFIGKKKNNTLEVALDFVMPAYRDFKTGKFVYEDCLDFFKEMGISRITASAKHIEHHNYLMKMGFKKIEEEDYYYLDI
jgi:N-acetylglutamate synthase-like GNAT family acetyltransferase